MVSDIQVPVCRAFVVNLNTLVAVFLEFVDERRTVGESEKIIDVRDEDQGNFRE